MSPRQAIENFDRLPFDGGGDRSDWYPAGDERDGGAILLTKRGGCEPGRIRGGGRGSATATASPGPAAAADAALGLGVRLTAALLLALWLSSCASYTRTKDGTQHLGLVASNATRVELGADGSLVIDGLDQGTPVREAVKVWGLLGIGKSLVSAADNAAQDALSTD